MQQSLTLRHLSTLQVFGFSGVAVLLLFLWQGHSGFNLWDEGFLWYGVQRVLLGEVPIRDFMAYDIGRYYWSAGLMSLADENGIIGVRLTAALFQALGLFVALIMIKQVWMKQAKGQLLFLIVSAVILLEWMYPRHKLFDISLSIFLVATLAYLVSQPSLKRYFLTGVCVGLIAVFGRNHGLYGAVASVGVILWLRINSSVNNYLFLKEVLYWSAGVLIGYLPVVIMIAFVPGFATAFLESILFLFEQKATNLPLPVQWPWLSDTSNLPFHDAVRWKLIGLFFLSMLVFGCLSLLWVVFKRYKNQPVSPVFVASAFLSLPYTHYAFSRADVGHLAQGIFPLMIGFIVLIASQRTLIKWSLLLFLCASSIWVMHVYQDGWQCRSASQCVSVEVSGSQVRVIPNVAKDITLLRQLAKDYTPNGESFLTVPNWPGAYALLERRSPIWEIYALFPRSEEFERKEIERIKAAQPKFVFVLDLPLDRREELRYRNTHPVTHQFILDNYMRMVDSPRPAYQIYTARQNRE